MKTKVSKMILPLLVIALMLVIAVEVKVTGAFLLDSITRSSDMSGGEIGCEVITSEEDGTRKISVKNTGTADGYIRASVLATWQNEDGDVYYETPEEGEDYTITYTDAWEKGDDGYWYFKNRTKAGNVTMPLTRNITEHSAEKPEGYRLHIDVTANIIQADPDGKPANEAWGWSDEE